MPLTRSPAAVAQRVDGARPDELVDAFLASGNSVLALAARSMTAATEEVTLAQYCVLVSLGHGDRRMLADVADVLGVEPSTAMRMSDRLASQALVSRRRVGMRGPAIEISLTGSGQELLDEVSGHLRGELTAVARRLRGDQRLALMAALRLITDVLREDSSARASAVPDGVSPVGCW